MATSYDGLYSSEGGGYNGDGYDPVLTFEGGRGPNKTSDPEDPTLNADWMPPVRTPTVTSNYPQTPGALGEGTGFQYTNPGFDDPATKQYFDLLSQLVGKLTGKLPDQGGQDFAQILNGLKTSNADNLSSYHGTLDSLMKQAQAPVFSDANLAALRTNAFDTLNSQRTADIQNTIRDLARRGINPKSGLAQAALQDVNRRWDTQEAQQRQGLNSYEIGQQAARPAQVASLAGARFGAGQAADTEQMGIGKALADLAAAKRAEEIANWSKALGLTSSGVSLTEDRLKSAQGAGQGSTGDISQLISAILGVANTTNAQNQTSAQNNAQWYQMLGQLLASYNDNKKN